ncbi:MAG: alpha/beta hydrolase [Flammeovirgaceae bacterium]|nr:alpha/beta hydrolase [Flammeovirgaceae bacterium]HCX24351.1 alpha/beta hydrolase [Cytophagales bacterium]|tara:strand:- start:3650 stop:4528 length:879 start_codon:yes stop_codon:yes gene_type:complete
MTTKMKTRFNYTLFVGLLILSLASFGQLKPTTTGLAPVNGIEMYYEVYQPDTKAKEVPIILLHGAFYTIEMNWSEIIPELSKTRKVIAIEMQGHGHSPFSDRPFDVVTLARDVEDILDYLKIEKVDVMGYSMGGSIAYQFATQSPNRLNKLVIISSTYKTDGWLPIVNSGFEGFKPEFFNDTPLQTGYYAAAPDTTQWTNFIEHMIEFADDPFDVGDDNIANLKAPVLIICGDNDGTDKVELMKTYQLLGGGITADMEPMPQSQLAIIPSQNHVSVMMQSEAILRYLEGFLD